MTASSSDFTWTDRTVTVNPGDSSTYIANIQITNDQIVEGDEIFRVLIDASSSFATNDGTALPVTIVDDDSKLNTIAHALYIFAKQ